MAVIGIDLGTTNSLAAVYKKGEAALISDGLGNLMMPSMVAIDMEGNILTGQAAKEEELLHPERCASNFKRFMGTEKVYTLADRKFTPEELSSLILRRIREETEEYLGEEVTEAVISVPAYFNNDQRYATKLAAELAGIYCERIINEPSAAALTARKTDMEGSSCFWFSTLEEELWTSPSWTVLKILWRSLRSQGITIWEGRILIMPSLRLSVRKTGLCGMPWEKSSRRRFFVKAGGARSSFPYAMM